MEYPSPEVLDRGWQALEASDRQLARERDRKRTLAVKIMSVKQPMFNLAGLPRDYRPA